jgi:hypothetical protein
MANRSRPGAAGLVLALAASLFGSAAQAHPSTSAPLAALLAPPPTSLLPPTEVRVFPPPFSSVFLLDRGVPVAQLSEPGTFTVASGRSYEVLVMQGPLQVFRGTVAAAGHPVDLAFHTAASPFGGPGRVAPAAPTPPCLLSRVELDDLLGAIDGASFERERLAIVRFAAPRHLFAVSQVRELLDRLAFDGEKLAALRALRPRIADPDEGVLLLDAFAFESSRERVLAMFGG